MDQAKVCARAWEKLAQVIARRLEGTLSSFRYRGSAAGAVSFPLGGIGTGCIGLSANGRLIDWEIFNRPNKGGLNGFTHFAVKAEAGGKVLDARVLVGDQPPPYMGDWRGYGFGLQREYMAGLPHFRETEFEGTYPIATIRFFDESFPGRLRLTAFNPFIPLDDTNSSLPAAFFEIEVENTSKETIEYTVCLSAQNPSTPGKGVNEYREVEKFKLILLSPTGVAEDAMEYGQLAIATDASEVSYQEYWYRGSWFDSLQVFWRDFTAPGRLRNRCYPKPQAMIRDHASLAAHARVEPGSSAKFRFLIAWFYPNCRNYWNPESERPRVWRNYYATVFSSAIDVARYCFEKWDELFELTKDFRDCLFATTAPPHVLDAVSSNLSILKSPTVLRLEDGSLYGFEGCAIDSGCCEGSCAHVWRYAIAPLYLFPSLDRSMWDLHLRYNLRADGKLSFRLMLPLGREWPFPHAAVDGQYGCLLRVYAIWKLTGDMEWLRRVWPKLKLMLEYAWSEANHDAWDRDRDGVVEGRQHNTFDVELFGPNSWLTGIYLAALKAAAEMAERLGDTVAEEYRRLFERGKRWVEENLFNGEFFVQCVNLEDKSTLERFSKDDPSVVEAYWSDEHGEVKYQLGEACFIAQVEGQFYANLFGLGEVLDRGKVEAALSSVYGYNFLRMRDHFNPCRVYALNDERGVVNCTWPRSGRPTVPIPYAEEVWSGLEYTVAAHMIQEGMVEQAFEIVKAVRERYDGVKRNPWNEIECGSNYARSMSSYALLVALSGFQWDAVAERLSLKPVHWVDGEHIAFWCSSSAWGLIYVSRSELLLAVRRGFFRLRRLRVPFAKFVKRVTVNGEPVRYETSESEIVFTEPVSVGERGILSVEFA